MIRLNIIIKWNHICDRFAKSVDEESKLYRELKWKGREDNRVCYSSADYSTKYERRSVDARGKHGYFRWCIPQRIAILILEYRSARGLVFAKSGCNRGDRGISKRAKFKLAAISWRFSLSSPPVISTLPLRTSARVPSLNAYVDGYLKCQIRNRKYGCFKVKINFRSCFIITHQLIVSHHSQAC